MCKINSKILELGKLPININDNNELFRLFNKTEEYLSATDPIIYTETQIFRKNEKNLNCSRHLKIFNDFIHFNFNSKENGIIFGEWGKICKLFSRKL